MNTYEGKPEDVGALMLKIAENLKDPVAREEVRASALAYIEQEKRGRNDLLGRYVFTKIKDIFAVLVILVSVDIVFNLFSISLFEGFVGLVAGFFLIRYIFNGRRNDLLSWFGGF